MSGQLRALKNRIRSVESTKKITRAMEMIAAAKMHRYQDMMLKGQAYADGLENLLKRLGSQNKSPKAPHPFLEAREGKKVGLLVMTSDTGLCGAHNSDLVHLALHFLQEHGPQTVLIGIGKIGVLGLKRLGYSFHETFVNIKTAQIEQKIQAIKTALERIYLEEKIDTLYAVYSHFLTSSSYKNVTEKLLPLVTQKAEEEKAGPPAADYLFEPDEQTILARLIPLFFEAKIRQIFFEAFVSEQIARMQAMHLATENATELIETLVLQRNKARQAAITKEIIEIVSGSRALKI